MWIHGKRKAKSDSTERCWCSQITEIVALHWPCRITLLITGWNSSMCERKSTALWSTHNFREGRLRIQIQDIGKNVISYSCNHHWACLCVLYACVQKHTSVPSFEILFSMQCYSWSNNLILMLFFSTFGLPIIYIVPYRGYTGWEWWEFSPVRSWDPY